MSKLLPEYKMTWPSLCMLVSNLSIWMKQDVVYFAERGITLADITAFEDLGNECEVFPSDVSILGDVMVAVEKRDAQRKAVYKLALSISGCIIFIFGEKSEQYKRLSAGKFTGSSDAVFTSLMRDLARISEELLPELSAAGLTQTKIDALKAATDLYELKVDAVADAKVMRKEKTIERITKGNQLYTLVTKYTALGKLLALEHKEVNYKKYVIYPNQKRKSADAE